jgi:4-amino-4-deoxy-L-arabinose transferase-like glycosyltransferase
MLIKGPIAVAFAVLSVLAWLAISRRWRLLAAYPWISGTAVFLAATAPWYLLAEKLRPDSNDLLFFERDDWQGLDADLRDQAQVVAQTSHWVAFVSRSHP